MGTLTPRASLIARRLYLSALAPLAVTGVAVVVGVGVSAFHDRAVTEEDRACFLAAKTKPKREAERRHRARALPPLPPGAVLDKLPPGAVLDKLPPGAVLDKLPPGWVLEKEKPDPNEFDPDKFSYAEQCHLDFTYNPEGHSTREWYGLDLPGGVAVAMLALLPALLLMVLARWLRWLLKS